MDKAARCELLHSLFHAKAGGFAYRHSGKPLRPNTDPIEGPGFGVWGKGGLREPNVSTGAPVPKPSLAPQTRRTARKHALTKIAEQLPAKLPRVLF